MCFKVKLIYHQTALNVILILLVHTSMFSGTVPLFPPQSICVTQWDIQVYFLSVDQTLCGTSVLFGSIAVSKSANSDPQSQTGKLACR